MPTLLPTDMDNNPIPAMRLKDNGAHTISASNTSHKNTLAFSEDTRIISIYSEVPVYIALGDATVTSTSADHYFPAGLYYDIAIGGDKTGHASHLAVLAADVNGSVYISEKE